MRFGTFDIETWDLGADFGPLLAACVEIDGKMHTLRQDDFVKRKLAEDMTDDRALLAELKALLDSCNMTSGWFTKGFDIAHVSTRLVKWGLPPLASRLHVDANWYFRGWRGLKTKTSKMKHVSEFFGFEEKPEVPAEVWLKARGGNRKAMDVVVDRCQADVRITRAITDKAFDLGLVRNISMYP